MTMKLETVDDVYFRLVWCQLTWVDLEEGLVWCQLAWVDLEEGLVWCQLAWVDLGEGLVWCLEEGPLNKFVLLLWYHT